MICRRKKSGVASEVAEAQCMLNSPSTPPHHLLGIELEYPALPRCLITQILMDNMYNHHVNNNMVPCAYQNVISLKHNRMHYRLYQNNMFNTRMLDHAISLLWGGTAFFLCFCRKRT